MNLANRKRVEQSVVRAVFLDRDGVINVPILRDGKPYPPCGLQDFELCPEVPETLQELRDAGFVLIVVTNQPDVARGTASREDVDAIHHHMLETLPLDDIKVCFGTSSETCDCYKPRPGMLLEAASEYGIDLAASYMVGDRWRDVGAGRAAGTFTIFVDRGYDEQRPDGQHATVASLKEAAEIILQRQTQWTVA
jgi:D-glycero-D-manno-heptose 1,7-bisphosphate phosphatase